MPQDTDILLEKIKFLAKEAKSENEISKKIRRLDELHKTLRLLEEELKLPKEYVKQARIAGFLDSSRKKKYLKDLNVQEKELKNFTRTLKNRKREKTLTKTFSIYRSNPYSRISNFFMSGISFRAEKKYPDLVNRLTYELAAANINILSKTYISIALFTGIISFPVVFAFTLLLSKSLVLSLIFPILGIPAVTFLVYKYPSIKIGERRAKLKQELVFAIVHMAAIAGSGAKPVEIFKQLVDSKDYEELEVELKRIDNYMNLFGYSLSNALRATSDITPSPELKDLLNGIISTIETGGDLKQNLDDKAEDSLVAFRLDQKKVLEKVETYSDIYTGLLIAGPLLMIVTLAILERISPTIGGISITSLALIGVFLVLPVLNIIYMLLVETSKSGV